MKRTRRTNDRGIRPRGKGGRPQTSLPQEIEAARPIGALLHRLAQKLHTEFEQALAPLGFAPAHYFVLINLSWHGPRSQLSLGGCAAINRTTMVALVDHLEELNLVERRPDPNDRRAYVIHLTDRGKRMLQRASRLHHDAEAHCLEPLSQTEQKLLRDLLGRLTTNS